MVTREVRCRAADAREGEEGSREKAGEEGAATLASLSLFTLILLDLGQWEEGEKLFVQVIETSKTKLAADYSNKLTSMATWRRRNSTTVGGRRSRSLGPRISKS